MANNQNAENDESEKYMWGLIISNRTNGAFIKNGCIYFFKNAEGAEEFCKENADVCVSDRTILTENKIAFYARRVGAKKYACVYDDGVVAPKDIAASKAGNEFYNDQFSKAAYLLKQNRDDAQLESMASSRVILPVAISEKEEKSEITYCYLRFRKAMESKDTETMDPPPVAIGFTDRLAFEDWKNASGQTMYSPVLCDIATVLRVSRDNGLIINPGENSLHLYLSPKRLKEIEHYAR